MHANQTRIKKRVAFTFDDIPWTDQRIGPEAVTLLTANLLKKLADNGVPATGFVNSRALACLGGRWRSLTRDLLGMWLEAGHQLGNHTANHLDLHQVSLCRFARDILCGEQILADVLRTRGEGLRYFRHPYLHTGITKSQKSAIDDYLRRRGYIVAAVTIKSEEWLFTLAYHHAMIRGDRQYMARLRQEYLKYMDLIFSFFEKFALELFPDGVQQVLLLHSGALAVDSLDDLVSMLRDRGYQFVTIEEALADPAYFLSDNYIGEIGLSWLHRWAMARGHQCTREPSAPGFVRAFYNS
jgi:peptidoglycan/xylan/chitin deacetylase (PgdA/CDA1 family)